MKERVPRIFRRDYLSKHRIEDSQVASLIRVVDSKSKDGFSGREEDIESLHRQFYKAGVPSFEYRYNPKGRKLFSELANQLHAIEQLGKSANNDALNYLSYLSTQDVRTAHQFPTVATMEEHSYPKARGVLKNFLHFNIQISTDNGDGIEHDVSPEDIQRQQERVRSSPAHKILDEAISTLIQDIQAVHR